MEKNAVNQRNAVVFKNKVLDTFTKTSPLIILIAYLPVAGAMLFFSYRDGILSFSEGVLTFTGGLFFWTFFEYVMHRYIFHYLSDSKVIMKFHYLVHGVHHEHPRDKSRLFMPPLIGYLIILVLFILSKLIMGSYVYVFVGGLIIGYLVYSLLHYSIHTIAKPHKIFRKLWRHHLNHHYKDTEKCYGVSTTVWDKVFGTTSE